MTTNFVDRITPIPASWLNTVDAMTKTDRASKIRDVTLPPYNAPVDETSDAYSAIQQCINDGYTAYLPKITFCVSQGVQLKDGTGIIGEGAHYNRRGIYSYSGGKASMLRYIGASAANTAVVIASAKAIGVKGTDFSGADTDDLINVTLRDFGVDGNDRADWGVYMYRCGNLSSISNVTAEGANIDGFWIGGVFAAFWGFLGAYVNRGRGFTVGQDTFGWGSEFACYNMNAILYAACNGYRPSGGSLTAVGNFVEGPFGVSATDENNCGVWIMAGRGSRVFISGEANYGRACVLTGSTAGGPYIYELGYNEINATGPKIHTFRGSTNMIVRGGFNHPPAATGVTNHEKIVIQAMSTAGTVVTQDEGCRYENEYLILENMGGASGAVGVEIYSNTPKYIVRNCGTIRYPTQAGKVSPSIPRMPTPQGVFGTLQFRADATLSDNRHVRGQQLVERFVGDGVTTAFTLMSAPTAKAGSTYMMDVWVDGQIRSDPGQYSYTGTTLTFVAAPALNTTIAVMRSNMTLTRLGIGRYRVDFTYPQPDSNYSVQVTALISPVAGEQFRLVSKDTTGFEIRTYNAANAAADTGAFLEVNVARANS